MDVDEDFFFLPGVLGMIPKRADSCEGGGGGPGCPQLDEMFRIHKLSNFSAIVTKI